jgi:hypothetical protein
MNECLIEGCPNEAKLIAKSGGKSYYACKEHRKDVAQIIAAEHTRAESERAEIAHKHLYPEGKEKPPKWIGF